MPPKAKFTREAMITAAVELVQADGPQALTARALGARLGTSSSPIFSMFESMDEVQQEVLKAAGVKFQTFVQQAMTDSPHPPYKAIGMAYIRFAREETQLFKLLFMRDRTHEAVGDDREALRPLLAMLQKNLGLTEDEAFRFHLAMWLFVHGMATMIATSYLEWDETFISQVLTDSFEGLKKQFCKERKP